MPEFALCGIAVAIVAMYLLVYAALSRVLTLCVALGLAVGVFYLAVTDVGVEAFASANHHKKHHKSAPGKKKHDMSLRSIVKAAVALPGETHAVIAPAIDALGNVFSAGDAPNHEVHRHTYPDLTDAEFKRMLIEYTYASAFLCRLQAHDPTTAAKLIVRLSV